MARLDWDRLRRIQPLDGADARVDPDGAVVWEREGERRGDAKPLRDRLEPWSGVRRLRAGIVVRRARERREGDAREEATARTPPPRPAMPFDASAWIECPRCNERVPRRKLLLHARAACARRA